MTSHELPPERRPNSLPGHSSLTITDNRTSKVYELPIYPGGFVRPLDFRLIKTPPNQSLDCYDPGYVNTICCVISNQDSAISYINGEKGELEFRGYAIQHLAKHCSYLEVAYLLLNGDLPTKPELERWEREVMGRMQLPKSVSRLIRAFRFNAPPMGILVSALTALSTLDPLTKMPDGWMNDPKALNSLIYKLFGVLPVIAAAAFRHKIGRSVRYPRKDLPYIHNFLYMMQDYSDEKLNKIAPVLETMFILQAEHEVNCSTSAVRVMAYAEANVYSCIGVGASALYGRRHGAANEGTVRMLEQIGDPSSIPAFILKVKSGQAKLMGFGHRVYKSPDPRAAVAKSLLQSLVTANGPEPLVDLAYELERQALSDSYFTKRKLYPNIDFYSGLIYRMIGFDCEMFPVLFAMALSAGWLAHWKEYVTAKEPEWYAPRARYVGERQRQWLDLDSRSRL